MVMEVRTPNIFASFEAGRQAAQGERLRDSADQRQNMLADLNVRAQDFREMDANRDFDFRVEARDFQRQQAEAAAAARARSAAASERARLRQEELAQIGRVLDFAGTLPEAERFETLSRFIDPQELAPFLIGPQANPILSDRVLNEMRLGYGMDPVQAAAPEFDLRELPDGSLGYVPKRPGQGGVIPVQGGEAPPPDAGWSPLSPEQIAASGLDPNQRWFGKPGEVPRAAGGGGVTINNNIPENYAPKTEGERLAGGFLLRMNNAERILQEFYGDGYTNPSVLRRAGSMVMPESWVLASDDLRVLQAQRDWVRAKLRKESGAVIGDQEMADEIKTYFPQPGDGPEVLAQKAASRQVAMQGMSIAAGLPAPLSMFGAEVGAEPVVINGQSYAPGTRMRIGGIEGVIEGGGFRADDGTFYDVMTGAPVPGR